MEFYQLNHEGIYINNLEAQEQNVIIEGLSTVLTLLTSLPESQKLGLEFI